MTVKEVLDLHSGDEVFWNDPDDGAGSRYYVIQSAVVSGEVVTITDVDGDVLECFAGELS